jgi:hypoxanthine phosphoribosyltransferase
MKLYGGNWKDGEAFALDVHTDPSHEVVGHNPFLDCPIYKKTDIGELVSTLKYSKAKKEKEECAQKILVNKSEKPSKMQWGADNKVMDIQATKNEEISENVLLVDDIFETGSTIDACIKVLKNHYKVKNIYVLCITQKRNKVIKL